MQPCGKSPPRHVVARSITSLPNIAAAAAAASGVAASVWASACPHIHMQHRGMLTQRIQKTCAYVVERAGTTRQSVNLQEPRSYAQHAASGCMQQPPWMHCTMCKQHFLQNNHRALIPCQKIAIHSAGVNQLDQLIGTANWT